MIPSILTPAVCAVQPTLSHAIHPTITSVSCPHMRHHTFRSYHSRRRGAGVRIPGVPEMTASKATKSLRVVLLAFDQMNLLDLSGPLQALASANRLHAGRGGPLYETSVASVHGGLITTSSGLPIMTAAIATLDRVPIDTLIVPGGSKDDEFRSPPAMVRWIARRAP